MDQFTKNYPLLCFPNNLCATIIWISPHLKKLDKSVLLKIQL